MSEFMFLKKLFSSVEFPPLYLLLAVGSISDSFVNFTDNYVLRLEYCVIAFPSRSTTADAFYLQTAGRKDLELMVYQSS